jgi:serine/threonine-protein kinase
MYLVALLFASACTGGSSPSGPDSDGANGDDGTTATGGNGGDSGGDTGTGGSGDTGTGGDGATGPDGGGGAAAGVGPYFSQPMFFNRDVTGAPKAANSASIISTLSSSGGWGTGHMQIDFAIDVLTADASAPMRTFTTTEDFYSPDCDHLAMPVPVGGNVEDESGYACSGGGDCHLIVNDPASHTLYEMWRADITSTFQGGCLAVWHTAQAYSDTLRGQQCTSADAAGFPIAPLLFSADEVAAGHIDHAIRFILPNNRVKRAFVKPATHGTFTSGGVNAPPYGVHLRLRADYPIDSLPSEGAKVVARAMQKYGMYHADGGNIALTAQSDRHTTHKWAGLLGAQDLSGLQVSDFEVIDHGGETAIGDCSR